MLNDYLASGTLLLVLLNPFLVTVYLIDAMQKLDGSVFRNVLLRAGAIASAVFCLFAALGDAVFRTAFQSHFASFQIFGGIIFLLIGLQFVFRGPQAIKLLRGDSKHIAGAIAMPVLIGPGTISVSVVLGERHPTWEACLIVILTVALSILLISGFKGLHDWVRPRYEGLVERYIEVTGRIAALFIGTYAVEMIVHGVRGWVDQI